MASAQVDRLKRDHKGDAEQDKQDEADDDQGSRDEFLPAGWITARGVTHCVWRWFRRCQAG